MVKKKHSTVGKTKAFKNASITRFFKKVDVPETVSKNDEKTSSQKRSFEDSKPQKVTNPPDDVLPPTPKHHTHKPRIRKSSGVCSEPLQPNYDNCMSQKKSCKENICNDKNSEIGKLQTSCTKVKTPSSCIKNCSNVKSTKRLILSKPLKRRSVSIEDKPAKKQLPERSTALLTEDDCIFLSYISKNKRNDDIRDEIVSEDLDDSLLGYINSEEKSIENESKNEIANPEKNSAMMDDSLIGFDDFEDSMAINECLLVLVVTKILEERFMGGRERLLHLADKSGEYNAVCHLRQDWLQMHVEENDLAFVSGLSRTCTHCILDNSCPDYITLYPNTLVSGTTISTGITCERKAVLNERFRTDQPTEAMLLGTMTHDLFEWALRNLSFSKESLERQANISLRTYKYLEMLYGLGTDETLMLSKLREYFSSITDWWKTYLKGPGKEINFKTGSGMKDGDSANVCVDNIVDIEENIWAPKVGLKGKVDVTVEVSVHKKSKLHKHTIPLELKTGRMFSPLGSIEHRAQVAIYTSLMTQKYCKEIDSGLLYYLKTKHLQGVPVPPQERRALVIKRNDLARKLTLEREHFYLPGVISDERQCKRCYRNNICMVYHKSMENGDESTSGVGDLFNDLTQHLTTRQLSFFKKWYLLVMMEAVYDEKRNKKHYLWSSCSHDCEKDGRCFSDMQISKNEVTDAGQPLYTFVRSERHFNREVSMLCLNFFVGDRVIVSEDNSNVYNITTGYVKDITSNAVHIFANQIINAIKPNSSYRIDKDNSLSTYKIPLSTLSKLFNNNSPKDEKLRRLIVEQDAPVFSICKEESINQSLMYKKESINQSLAYKEESINQSLAYKEESINQSLAYKEESINQSLAYKCDAPWRSQQGKALNNIFSRLNKVQKEAIERSLVAEDFLLILGMPGAGKSTTVACLVRSLVSMGKSVLLTSYTHSAIDTILLKLLQVDFDSFVRLGEASRVHEKVVHRTLKEMTSSFTSSHQLREFFNSQRVVATTCLGINHPVFLHKHFDYCIVDEASQVTLPVCLGPLRYANTFILVGDHNQLPPLVQNSEAREKGLDESLFRLLSECHPQAVLTLNSQYRMNNHIMLLTNSLVYNNLMECGDDQVAHARILLPNYKHVQEDRFLTDVINPLKCVVFIDTDSSSTFAETKSSTGIFNQQEAMLTGRIVRTFIELGLTPQEIGVISPYRLQLKAIRESLGQDTVDIDTIDKFQVSCFKLIASVAPASSFFQGKDKQCVVVSLVRSNQTNEIGDLLTDWRRVNVAITRAKTKLIMIGSLSTVTTNEMFERMATLLKTQGWVVRVQDIL